MKTPLTFLACILAFTSLTSVHASPMQAASCAAIKCPAVKGNFCSATSSTPTAFTTTYANQCECLKAKCQDKKIQCYAKATKCNPTDLQQLAGKTASIIAPSCGSNGITYDNYYQMKVARALDPNIQFLISGKCPTTITKCMKKKCPQSRDKVCAIEKAGKSPVFYQNQCFFDIGKCLNPSLTVSSTCPPMATKAKALSAENTFSLSSNTTTTVTTNTTSSGSGSYDEPLGDEIPYTDGEDFYVGMDLMDLFSSNGSSSGSSNSTISSTTKPPATKGSSASTAIVSVSVLAITTLNLM
uniref:Secreted protein n=1 Tax=Thraustotheca clavata TaxID=74557 RepID=A0A0A7CLL9_9STRA|nr:secreted protein [Thraustotheca clavata]